MRAQTTKSIRIQIISLILAGLISMPAHAEVIPGRWEKVAALAVGIGARISGQFRGLSSSDARTPERRQPGIDSASGYPDHLRGFLPRMDGSMRAWKGAADWGRSRWWARRAWICRSKGLLVSAWTWP